MIHQKNLEYAVVKKATQVVIAGSAIALTVDYLITHPEKTSEWFSLYPEQLVPVTNYIDKKIESAKTQQEYDKYNNVKQQLALDQDVNQNQEKTIENDPLYQQIEANLRQEITSATITIEQSGRMPNCSINIVAQVLEPTDTFENGIGSILPTIQGQPTNVLNVGTYKKLTKNYKSTSAPIKLTPDHIPSYGALSDYFKNHGYPIPKVRRNSNLENNTSTIAIPTEIHQLGSRTYGGRNNSKTNGNTTITKDANNLLEATILDIATMAFVIQKNPQYNISTVNYINNSIVLFERNKLLCMYDVK